MRIVHFDADGWRARFDEGFDEATVRRIGYALGVLWGEMRPGATVLIGYDTRYRGFEFAWSLGEVLASFGLDVRVSCEICPTPALGWAIAHDPDCVGGVMFSASSAPCEYGGLLIRGEDGGPVLSGFLARLERTIPTEEYVRGIAPNLCCFTNDYIDALLSYVDVDAIAAAGFRVVADPMHGAGSGILPLMLERAGCQVDKLHDEPLQDFDGLHPRPSEPWVDECEQVVVGIGADCAVTLDGDGDRFGMIDERGRLVSHHDVVPLIMERLVRSHGLMGRVVVSMACSERVTREAELLGCTVTRVPVGFERAYEELAEGDVIFACEEFGGICVPQHMYERDGFLGALLVLEHMALTGKTLSSLASSLKYSLGYMRYGYRDVHLDAGQVQTVRNVLPGTNPSKIAGKTPVHVSHADGLRLLFDNGAWVMIRPARREPIVRVYCEAPTSEERDSLLNATIEEFCGA